MPDLTRPFDQIFNAIRGVNQVDGKAPLQFLDGEGNELGVIEGGFLIDELSSGAGGGEKVLELLITDRPGIDQWIYEAERYDLAGVRYERVGSPSAPSGNPAVWTMRVKPIRRRQ